MITAEERLLLRLVRMGLGNGGVCDLAERIEWNALLDLAVQQGVPAIVLDGVKDVLPSPFAAGDRLCKMQWVGMVMNMERQYAAYEKVIGELAAFYQQNGINMMLLKGYGLSKYWPVPNHRPVGDIDIYLMGDGNKVWKRADQLLHERLGIEVDNGHHHHSVFTYRGVMVENHYDFVNVHSHRSSRWIERLFKRLAASGHETYMLDNGARIILPSPLLNMLFVARHSACHFAAEGMTLRMLCDWVLLARQRKDDIDWDEFWKICVVMGMAKFVLCMAHIAHRYLGFALDVFHIPAVYSNFGTEEAELIERVLEDCFSSRHKVKEPAGVGYIIARYKLWKGNLWKHRIVYTDSVISTFLAQIKSHLMKPATIIGN